jgi:predicted porin
MQRCALFHGEFLRNLWLRKQQVGKLCAASAVPGGDRRQRRFVFKQTTGDVFMQKKLLAVAVAAALAPAAAMAQSTVEIYGRANLGIDQYKATGATDGDAGFKSRIRVYEGSSRLGFRVNESLGGGMRAFVVLETGVNIDTGNNVGQSGSTANANTGFWASRDSYAGIGGGWGDVRFGRQSIYWSNGIIAQTGANYINTAVDGLQNGIGMVAIPVTRQSNVISYNSPTVGAFNASVSFSPSTTEGATYTGTGQEKDSIWGVTGRYSSGPLRGQLDWAKRKNNGYASGRDISGIKVGVGWAYAPGSQISYVLQRAENKNIAAAIGDSANAGDSLKVNIHLVNWEHMLGQWQLLAQYAFTNEVKGLSGADTGNTKVRGITLAGKYFLSKRTGVYASFNKITNQANSFADFSGGAHSSALGGALSAANEGADPTIIAVGVMHNF